MRSKPHEFGRFHARRYSRNRARPRARRRARRVARRARRSGRKAVATPSPTCARAGRSFLDAWARLGQLARDDVEAYAYFRVGYHRGLDRLRQSGWRGSGYVRWNHETNRGFLRALEGSALGGRGDRRGRRGPALRRIPPPAGPGLGPALRLASIHVKRALITGITGQDGRHLSEFLSGKGYQVFGLVHGQANPKIELVQDENPSLELIEGDLRDLSSLIAVVEQVQPDEVYNLGAISFVQLSFKQAELTAEITGLGVLAHARSGAHGRRHREQPDSLLPGVVVGDVRQGARDAADRDHAVPPALARTASRRCSVTTRR